MAFARLLDQQPELFDGRGPTDVPFWPADPALTGPLRPEHLDWQAMIVPPDPPVEFDPLDAEELAQFATLPTMPGLAFEVDVFFPPTTIWDQEPPWFARTALVVTAPDGIVAGCHLAPSPEATGRALAPRAVIQALARLRRRPTELRVCRPRVARELERVAAQLGAALVSVPELPGLNEARWELENALRHRDPGLPYL